jgi:hypothetical protein
MALHAARYPEKFHSGVVVSPAEKELLQYITIENPNYALHSLTQSAALDARRRPDHRVIIILRAIGRC